MLRILAKSRNGRFFQGPGKPWTINRRHKTDQRPLFVLKSLHPKSPLPRYQALNTKPQTSSPICHKLGSFLSSGPVLIPQNSTAAFQKDPEMDPNLENYPTVNPKPLALNLKPETLSPKMLTPPRLGFFGGITWAILVARVCQPCPQLELNL